MKNGQRGGGSVFVDKHKCRTRHGVVTAGTRYQTLAKVGFAGPHLSVQQHKVAAREQGSKRSSPRNRLGYR